MARTFAKSFYNSKEWKDCNKSYIANMPKHCRGLCERCFQKGKKILGTQLHHKVWLTPNNINNPAITLNHKLLELLCDTCHAQEHNTKNKQPKRYLFDNNGNVIAPHSKSN